MLEFDCVRCWTRDDNEKEELWLMSYIGLCLSSALWWQL